MAIRICVVCDAHFRARNDPRIVACSEACQMKRARERAAKSMRAARKREPERFREHRRRWKEKREALAP